MSSCCHGSIGYILALVMSIIVASSACSAEGGGQDLEDLPDLVIIEYEFGRIDPQLAPGNYDVYVTVQNQGYTNVSGFDVALYLEGEVHERTTVDTILATNESVRLNLELHIDEGGRYNLTVVLDPDEMIEEIDEENNAVYDKQSFAENPSFCSSTMVIMLVPFTVCLTFVARRPDRGVNDAPGDDGLNEEANGSPE